MNLIDSFFLTESVQTVVTEKEVSAKNKETTTPGNFLLLF